jgi:hypothetical protein
MELYKIKRNVFGTEVEIELTLGEMNDCYDKIREYNMREILNELLACDGCANVPKEIIDSVVQDALEEQDESGDSVFTAIDTVYKKRNFNKYKQETPDMSITVGHVIDNPTFDFGGKFQIIDVNETGFIDVLYDSIRDNTKDIPADLLIKPVQYMSTNEHNGLVLEV